MRTPEQIQADIDRINAQRSSGVKKMAENGRLMEFDMGVLQERLDELGNELQQAQAGVVQPSRPIRRILTYTASKGL